MHLVDNDTFLKQLSTVFEESNKSGQSVWLTHKRLTYTGDGDVQMTSVEGEDTKEYPCLLRCTDGKKNHMSTHIMSNDLDKFHAAYGSIFKTAMTPSMRKRDKKKEKERAERIARKQKRLAEPILIEGPKRGAGRRKRQRRIKAALKQDETRRKREDGQAKAKS